MRLSKWITSRKINTEQQHYRSYLPWGITSTSASAWSCASTPVRKSLQEATKAYRGKTGCSYSNIFKFLVVVVIGKVVRKTGKRPQRKKRKDIEQIGSRRDKLTRHHPFRPPFFRTETPNLTGLVPETWWRLAMHCCCAWRASRTSGDARSQAHVHARLTRDIRACDRCDRTGGSMTNAAFFWWPSHDHWSPKAPLQFIACVHVSSSNEIIRFHFSGELRRAWKSSLRVRSVFL